MTQLLRVHGGELGGRRLSTPKGIRPSQGVVKEAIFNVLAAEVEGARVLDLFAGSGALGIEALSRGAAQATFVESEPRVVAVLKRNLAGLGLDGRARVVIADAARWSELHPTEVGKADLVLLDPPYGDRAAGRGPGRARPVRRRHRGPGVVGQGAAAGPGAAGGAPGPGVWRDPPYNPVAEMRWQPST